MSVFHLESLFAPASLAVVGRFGRATHKERTILDNVCGSRCGDVAIVDLDGSPRPEGLAPCGRWQTGLGGLGADLDVVVASLPVCELPGLIDACGERRVKSMILTHRRMTPEDEACESAVAERARRAGIRLLGLNSFGLIVPDLGLNTSYFEAHPAGGSLALLSQSGALVSSVLDAAARRGIGFSHVVSVGSLLDIDFGDVVDYLVWEKSVRCVLLYIENLGAVKKFLSACRAAARHKPLVAVKGGRSLLGRELIAKHTGGAAGEDKVYDTALRRAGVIRVDTIDELLGSGESLARKRTPRGDRLGVVTNSGGIGVLAADGLTLGGARLAPLSAALQEGLAQYRAPYSGHLNPICIAGDADSERYVDVLTTCVRSDEFDTLLVIMGLSGVFSPGAVVEAVAGEAAQGRVEVVYVWLGGAARHEEEARRLAERGHTIFHSVEEAVAACAFSTKYFDMRSKVSVIPPRFDRTLSYRQAEARRLVDESLAGRGERGGGVDTLGLLSLYGIPSDPAPREAAEYELRIGARTDVEFGPYLFLGVGGLMSRVAGDEAVILPPLDRRLARRLVEKSGLVARMDVGAADREQLEEILVRLSQLVVDFPELQELEINPLAWSRKGFFAQAARAVLAEAAVASPFHLATAPYPNQYEFVERLKDGREVLIRPIRPEDAASHLAFIRGLSSQTLYNRFFGFSRTITDEQLIRFTQIDYDREIAIVARVTDESGEEVTIGVNRLAYDAHAGTYEFAVVVADAWQGSGIGSLLMDKLLYVARDRRIKAVFGLVLPRNRRMLALSEKFGFHIVDRDEDAVTIRVDLE